MYNPILYLRRNKKRTFLIMFFLSVAVFCVSFVATLISSVYDTALMANTSPLSMFSVVFPKSSSEIVFPDNTINVTAIESIVTTTSIKTVFGTTSAYIFFPANSDQIDFLCNRCSLKITEGRLPKEKANEIILHDSILKNKGVAVGGSINNFKIVGSYSGKISVGFGSLDTDNYSKFQQLGKAGYILYHNDVFSDEYQHYLGEFSGNNCELISYQSAVKHLDEEFETTDTILSIVVILVSISLAIASAAIIYTHYAGRYDEFAILNAIGYKKKRIIHNAVNEILILCGSSWIIGYALSLIGLFLANKLIYSDMGQEMHILNADSTLYTLVLPVLSIVCTVIPVASKLHKTDLISVIERRA